MTRHIVASRKQDWSTPDELVRTWEKEFDLNIDLCAEPYNARLPKFITPGMNSLATLWKDPMRGFCNPPYDNIGAWMLQALRSCGEGAFTVMLVPANPDTEWFHKFAIHAQIDFFRRRVNFVDRTPPALEIERLLKGKPTHATAEKIAHRLIRLKKEAGVLSEEALNFCTALLGEGWQTCGKYAAEKPPGAGFPTMLVIFDPSAAAGPKSIRTRCGKTGILL